ncbi:MAG: response regulator [Sphingobacteriales bacterium]|nr:MAG: response regulator [Sphingobacteriales bacterium]
MNKKGPIIIIEDNKADQRLFEIVFEKICVENELKFFTDGAEALDYLNNSKNVPFIIISDINIPKMNGFEVRERIHQNEELSLKCVPFLFFSTGAEKESIVNAYALSVQGFFQKPMDVDSLEKTLQRILDYWKDCIAPNDYSS